MSQSEQINPQFVEDCKQRCPSINKIPFEAMKVQEELGQLLGKLPKLLNSWYKPF